MKRRLGYPLFLTLLYLLIGGLWILLTDRLTAWLFTDPHTLLLANTYKGWFYVAVTAFLLYLELRRESGVRKRDEAALRESEARYHLIAEYVDDIIWQLDTDLHFTYVSPAVEHVLGYSTREANGLRVMDLLDENGIARMQAVIQDGSEHKTDPGSPTTYKMKHKNGSWVDVEVLSTPVYDDDGHPVGFVGITRDITGRMQTEEKLIASETRYRRLFEAARDGILILDAESGVVVDVNPFLVEMLGFPQEAILGKELWELGFFKDIAANKANFLELQQKGYMRYEDLPLETADGRKFHVEFVSNVYQVNHHKVVQCNIRDITERMQADMAVRASEQQLKSYIESAGDAIYVIETGTGRIRNCNGRACLDLGYSREELLELSTQAIEFKLTAGEVDAIHHELKPGEVKTIAGTHKRKDGSAFPVEIRLSSLAPAQPEFMLAIARDITERKQFEEKLSESEARYQLIFEHSGTANTIFDKDCRVILQNSQSQMLTRPADALGKTALEVFGPEQGPIVDGRMRRAMASGVAEVFETKFSMPGGERWIRSSYQPLLDEQHAVVGIQVISQDITPQKQAEELLHETSERLTHMLANSPTVIYALNVTGDQATPIWISENIEAVLGFRAEAALQPDWWQQQVDPQDRSDALASLEHLFDDFYQHEYHFLHKDGRAIWLHDEHRLLRDEKKQPREIIGAWTDITERKQAEEALRDYNIRLALDVVERTRELQEAQEKLVRQEKLAVLGQLAGGVGHELRNPLAVINNAVYYLKLVQPDVDEKVHKYHGVIEHEVHNAEMIITDLLDFARARSADREPVDLPALVQRVLERFPPPEAIETVLEIPADLPQLYVDPRQVEQVLGNLAVNACQAMAGAGTLSISARLEKDLVVIAVKDTGTGITAENMKKLFEPLFTTKPKGIGLGLAVSRKLVEANSGRIEVQSAAGQGSTFMLYLPVQS